MQYHGVHTCKTCTNSLGFFLFGTDLHFYFEFWKTLHNCKSNRELFGQSDCTFRIPAKQRIRKKTNLSPDCEWTDWDRTWGRGWRPSCSWVWAGGAVCVGQPAAGRGTLLAGPSSPSPRPALTGGLQCNTKNSAVPGFKTKVQSLVERLKAQEQSKEGGGAAVPLPGFQTKVLSFWERFKAQEQSKEGGGAAVPGFKTKVQSLWERFKAQEHSEEGGEAGLSWWVGPSFASAFNSWLSRLLSSWLCSAQLLKEEVVLHNFLNRSPPP